MTGRIAFVPCIQCCAEDIKNGRIPDSTTYEILTSDSGTIFFNCKNNHENCLIIQEHPFEILLEMAVENLIDRYYREAIFNFAAAQERCFEFFNELILFERQVENKLYEKLWKTVYKNSSERQLGAFYFLYFMRFKKTFSYDDNKNAIRNSIVHKGEIATKQKAFDYGTYILNNIYIIIEAIVENINPKTLSDFISKKLADKQFKANLKPNVQISVMSASIISWTCMTDEEVVQERKLIQYSKLNPEEYAQKASEANSYGNKKLYINEKNELIIIDAPDINTKKVGAHYRGRRSLKDLIEHVKKMRKLNTEIKSSQMEKAAIVSCLDE